MENGLQASPLTCSKAHPGRNPPESCSALWQWSQHYKATESCRYCTQKYGSARPSRRGAPCDMLDGIVPQQVALNLTLASSLWDAEDRRHRVQAWSHASPVLCLRGCTVVLLRWCGYHSESDGESPSCTAIQPYRQQLLHAHRAMNGSDGTTSFRTDRQCLDRNLISA